MASQKPFAIKELPPHSILAACLLLPNVLPVSASPPDSGSYRLQLFCKRRFTLSPIFRIFAKARALASFTI
jgi:hypothetical protein